MVGGEQIKERAEMIAKELKITDCKFSDGWFSRFKADPAETEKENPVTTTTAMKMARYLRSYLQSNSGSLEQLQCLSLI